MEYFQKFLIAILLLGIYNLDAQNAHDLLKQADNGYDKKKYDEAEENYSAAKLLKKSEITDYNLANTSYKKKKYKEAIKLYDDVVNKSTNPSLKQKAFFNKGNAHFQNKEYGEAAKDYKDALKINPDDEEARMNYALAKKMIQEQKKDQENKEKNKEQNKDKQDKKDQEDSTKQQSQKQDPIEFDEKDLQKKDALKMLEIMNYEERKVQQRVNKSKVKQSRTDKDW
jgi:Ca-activated chloride channel homolog